MISLPVSSALSTQLSPKAQKPHPAAELSGGGIIMGKPNSIYSELFPLTLYYTSRDDHCLC